MSSTSFNCIVCAQECNSNEVKHVVSSDINNTRFKICETCLNQSDPADDYRQAREIVNSYIKLSQAKSLFHEVKDLLKSRKNV